MNTNLSIVFRIFLIRYANVAKMFKFHLITLLNTVICIVPNIFNFNNDQLTEILLYGKEDLDNINNTSILYATINCLIETKRFDTQLFWCSPDVMALTLILHLKFIFLFFFSFCFYYFYLFIIFWLFFNRDMRLFEMLIPRNVWGHSPEYSIPRVPPIPLPVPVFLVLYIAVFKI